MRRHVFAVDCRRAERAAVIAGLYANFCGVPILGELKRLLLDLPGAIKFAAELEHVLDGKQ